MSLEELLLRGRDSRTRLRVNTEIFSLSVDSTLLNKGFSLYQQTSLVYRCRTGNRHGRRSRVKARDKLRTTLVNENDSDKTDFCFSFTI